MAIAEGEFKAIFMLDIGSKLMVCMNDTLRYKIQHLFENRGAEYAVVPSFNAHASLNLCVEG
jgi:hypothetical protein